MAIPNVVYGSYGDEKVTSTSKIGGLPLGTKMELLDGRIFRHARAGGTALVVGKLHQGSGTAQVANTIFHQGAISLVPNAAPAGAATLSITLAGTALTAGVFDDAYLVIASSIGTGKGYTYKVASVDAHTSVTGTSVVHLAENDTLKVALEASTTKLQIRKNPWDLVDITLGSTVAINTFAGVTANSVAASSYCWLQTRGPVGVFTDATTLIVGMPVVASSTVAGAVAVPVLAGTGAASTVTVLKEQLPIGICMIASATTNQYALIDLMLE